MNHLEHLFKSYPTVDEWHITSDEQAFQSKHHADTHAVTLTKKGKDGNVKTYQRGDEKEPVKEVPEQEEKEEIKAAPHKAAPKKK